MSKKYAKYTIITIMMMIFIASFSLKVYAATDTTIPVPRVNISVDNAATPKDYVDNIKILIMLTILTLLPSIMMMMTSFVRIIIVLSFLRSAIGSQQSPPNQILLGLAIFLTIFIMMPTFNTINQKAITPYLNNQIDQTTAIQEGSKPLREFMLRTTNQDDLKLFIEAAKLEPGTITKDNVPLYVVIPAFMISELKTAFMMGFLIFLPFIIIDLVVSSILMSMGMFMLPPAMISLPFKLLLFVMVNGWYLIVRTLIISFSG